MIFDEGYYSPEPKKVVWENTQENIDIAHVRACAVRNTQKLRQYVADRNRCGYRSGRDNRVSGLSPQDCKDLTHFLVDLLLMDDPRPFAIREQAINDAVNLLLPQIHPDNPVFFVHPHKKSKSEEGLEFRSGSLLFTLDALYTENLEIWDFAEARLQSTTVRNSKFKA